MSDPEVKKDVPLWARIACGFLASGATSLLLTVCSLAGTNFELLGINSEIIKAGITSTLTGVFVAPECIPITIAAAILSVRMSRRMIENAFTKELPPEDKQ